MSEIRERQVKSVSGIPLLVEFIVFCFATGIINGPTRFVAIIIAVPTLICAVAGLHKVEPNQSAVLSLFGKYVGSAL